MAIGVRLALEPGRGRTAVPVRAAMAGAAAAVCAVTAAMVFTASLGYLINGSLLIMAVGRGRAAFLP